MICAEPASFFSSSGHIVTWLCRFYLPECWRIPVSIEGKDMQPWTLHGPRRHPSIASWQVVQVWQSGPLHSPAGLHICVMPPDAGSVMAFCPCLPHEKHHKSRAEVWP